MVRRDRSNPEMVMRNPFREQRTVFDHACASHPKRPLLRFVVIVPTPHAWGVPHQQNLISRAPTALTYMCTYGRADTFNPALLRAIHTILYFLGGC